MSQEVYEAVKEWANEVYERVQSERKEPDRSEAMSGVIVNKVFKVPMHFMRGVVLAIEGKESTIKASREEVDAVLALRELSKRRLEKFTKLELVGELMVLPALTVAEYNKTSPVELTLEEYKNALIYLGTKFGVGVIITNGGELR